MISMIILYIALYVSNIVAWLESLASQLLKHVARRFLLPVCIPRARYTCIHIHRTNKIYSRETSLSRMSHEACRTFFLISIYIPWISKTEWWTYLYINITVSQGSIKFAGRFFLISIHPMKLNGTMMNSFLFNVGLLLICTVSVTQLCATAFRVYAHSSAISQIFVAQIQYLKVIHVCMYVCVMYICVSICNGCMCDL
jgi:hypothetical protein